MSEEALNQETEPGITDFLYNATNQGEETATEEVQTDEVVEEQETASEEAEASTDDEVEISSVTELVEHLEADTEWFNNLKMPITVNGKPAEATLQQMVDSYQTQEAAQDRLEDAKQKASALRTEATEARDTAKQEAGVAAGMVLLAP